MKNTKVKSKPRKMTDEERKVLEEFEMKIVNFENNFESVMDLDNKLKKSNM